MQQQPSCRLLVALTRCDRQAGTFYGLWGTLLVAYGIVFAGLIDLLGASLSHALHLYMPSRLLCALLGLSLSTL